MRAGSRRALAELQADGAEYVSPLRALIVRRAGPDAAPHPAPRDQVLLTDARFILKPHLDAPAVGVAVAGFRDSGRETFLKASIASGSCPCARGRAERQR